LPDERASVIRAHVDRNTFGAGEELSLVENISPPPPNGAVPEPRNIASLATGVLLLAMMLRRKKPGRLSILGICRPPYYSARAGF
jgi:hypothetical protein